MPKEVRWTTRPDVSPLRYPGGKRRLAPFVASLVRRSLGTADLLVEPFAGGAAVSVSLLEAGYAREIALSDIDPLVSAFWMTVFSSEARLLAEMAAEAVLTLDEWKRQKALAPRGKLEAAYKCLYLNRTSFSGSIMAYAGPMGGKSQAGRDSIGSRFNRAAIAERILGLQGLSDRVRSVTQSCWSETAKDVRKAGHGGTGVFWYLDPPYFAKARRLYAHSFGADDHLRLAGAVDGLPGRWVLSYDDCPESERLYGGHPGFARLATRYNVRVDTGQRRAIEIVVSDVIAELREVGDASFGGNVEIPARRKYSSETV